jgi:hypothetical protein
LPSSLTPKQRPEATFLDKFPDPETEGKGGIRWKLPNYQSVNPVTDPFTVSPQLKGALNRIKTNEHWNKNNNHICPSVNQIQKYGAVRGALGAENTDCAFPQHYMAFMGKENKSNHNLF